MSQSIIVNGQSGLSVREALNTMFGELYGAVVSPIKLSNVATTSQAFVANTWIEKLFIIAYTGSPTIKIGTTLGGSDVLSDGAGGPVSIGTSLPVIIQTYYFSATTYYFTISGGNCNIRIDSILNYF
jgi:hypothetical protein